MNDQQISEEINRLNGILLMLMVYRNLTLSGVEEWQVEATLNQRNLLRRVHTKQLTYPL